MTLDLRRATALLLAWVSAVWLVLQEIPLFAERKPYSIGWDSRAYWFAWSHRLYDQDPAQTLGRYLYSPAFADVMRPFSALPWHVFAVGWLLAMLGIYLWLLAPVRWLYRLPLLIFLGLDDVLLGNIHALLALMLVFAFRYPAAWALALLTKPPMAIGCLWFVVRGEWRHLRTVALSTLAVVLVTLPFAPHLWLTWLRLLTSGDVHPVGGFAVYAVRLVIAMAVIIVAARKNCAWLVPVGLVIGMPMFDPAAFGLLAAIPRLRTAP